MIRCVDAWGHVYQEHLVRKQTSLNWSFCSRCAANLGENPNYIPEHDFENQEKQGSRIFDAPSAENTDGKFNLGLAQVTYGTRHAEKVAKQKGLQPIGDAPVPQAKNDTQSKIDGIMREGIKAARVGRTLEGVPLKHVIKGYKQ